MPIQRSTVKMAYRQMFGRELSIRRSTGNGLRRGWKVADGDEVRTFDTLWDVVDWMHDKRKAGKR